MTAMSEIFKKPSLDCFECSITGAYCCRTLAPHQSIDWIDCRQCSIPIAESLRTKRKVKQ